MSSVFISKDGHITQRLRGKTEELGRIVKDEIDPGTWVLELKDLAGVAVGAGNYLRPGDRYSSWDDATRREVLNSISSVYVAYDLAAAVSLGETQSKSCVIA